ncbi:hypothetical protein BDBG_00436 [Blastomyces gilchristii SLH14081]|uniref:Arb2 domain-containing protein n=1 Tax=Blastomyces gilchristii (strain SLH14081) TaxID=559298 RepID=A0A179U9B7_BLAGS|nr:uncharacterized protein BDBG_00436 [Blastomyces gilchristii SLH14081]OAT03747.1 hypothetical protein BDBG_00436 [Blastomyces gilchristii SLH14081]
MLTPFLSLFSFVYSHLLHPIYRTTRRSIMFVFRAEDLPKDPVFPADLKQLGYFINDQDQIKKISNPEEDFVFKINTNDRYNEMQKEAMNTCIRQIVISRLLNLGLETLRLPIGAAANSQHVSILTSPAFQSQPRLIVVFGDPTQDLGIWAYRVISKKGINIGSAVNFATAVVGDSSSSPMGSEYQTANTNVANSSKNQDQKQSQDNWSNSRTGTGLILTNPGQLVWHCGKEQAISLPMWHALPRRSAVEPPMRMTFRNKIPGNETWQDHITYVFEEVLGKLAAPDVKIDVIGLAEGGLGAVRYLAEHWPTWQSRISSICLTNPLHDTNHLHPPEFATFMSTRSRAYLLSEKPLSTPVAGRYEFGCNCYSAGEALDVESIMPRAWGGMLKWLDVMFENSALEEVEVIVAEDGEGEGDVVAS